MFAEAADRVGVELERHVVEGQPATVLVEVARTVGADLLGTGNRGMSGVRRLLGSVPNSLAHHTPGAVLAGGADSRPVTWCTHDRRDSGKQWSSTFH